MDAIVFDIDGTLADVEHRRHLLPDWGKFFDAMVDDPPIEDVCWLANMLSEGGFDKYGDYVGCEVFLMSGRPETHRKQTESWIWDNVRELSGHFSALLMRAEGDYRSDVVVKREMLNGLRGQGYDVRMVFDDRKSVVDMWRSEGITCAQVAPGFDEASKYEPGPLTLLVGPSGAGKSSWAVHGSPPDALVSSDKIRERLCGDFKDQSKNKQVFDALHAVVEARIKSGLPAVVDATNIKNAARKRFLKEAPENCKIYYLVFDRTPGQKRLTAGWRADVTVKGKSLLDYHHTVFQSNLKDILSGDGDPRVVVIDMRGEACK